MERSLAHGAGQQFYLASNTFQTPRCMNDDAKAPEEDPDHGIEKEEEDAEDTDMLDKAKAIGVEVK